MAFHPYHMNFYWREKKNKKKIIKSQRWRNGTAVTQGSFEDQTMLRTSFLEKCRQGTASSLLQCGKFALGTDFRACI